MSERDAFVTVACANATVYFIHDTQTSAYCPGVLGPGVSGVGVCFLCAQRAEGAGHPSGLVGPRESSNLLVFF